MPDGPRIPVRALGWWRGAAVDADGFVRVAGDVVSVLVDDRDHHVRIDRLDGVAWRPPTLALHVAGERLELTGHASLETLAAHITRRALELPELTRTMHGLGSRRGSPGSEHDRFFAALLRARRQAEELEQLESRLAAFDAARLRRALTEVIGELAAERFPDSGPFRRALEAELLEHAERVYAALDVLGDAAAATRSAGDDARLARWRVWTWSAHRVFEEADRCWIAVLRTLTAMPAPKPRKRRFWRRGPLPPPRSRGADR